MVKTTRVVHQVITEILYPYCGSNQFIRDPDCRFLMKGWICAECGKVAVGPMPAVGDLEMGEVVSEKIVEYLE